jgi:hypothetical protein
MSWATGVNFDFAAGSGYVTHPANTIVVDAFGSTYPQSVSLDGDTIVYGWENGSASMGHANRDSGVDPRLASFCYVGGSGEKAFRVDLPATGGFEFDWAMGDPIGTQNPKAELRDTASVLITVPETVTTAGQFIDAALTTHTSAANWVANHAAVTETFATTIMRFVLQVPSAEVSPICHLSIKTAAGGGGGLTVPLNILMPAQFGFSPGR